MNTTEQTAPANALPPIPTAWRPWLLALALWLLIVAVALLALWHLQRSAVEGEKRELNLLSLAVTDEIERGLRGAEEGMLAVRTELHAGRLPLSESEARRSLSERAELMPLVRTLWLIDESGQAIASSDGSKPPAPASFLPALGTLATDAVSLSRPFSAAPERQAMVALAIRFNNASGRSGWILAAIPASTLLGAFSATMPAADARLAIFRSDGARLADLQNQTPNLDESTLARQLSQRPDIEVRTFRDGRPHVVGLHSVPRYDIKIAVSRDLAAVLTPWRETAQFSVGALVLLLLGIALAVRSVLRADRRRAESQRALQAQLARADKLQSLGTLAGGVAHDFNNVLAGIIGFGEMAQDAAAPGSAQARHLDKVLGAALRGKSLVERILAFSRSGARTSMVFELEPIVEEALTLLSASLRPSVVLERVLEAPDGCVRGDPTQAFEAVMNLCTNAMQAMPPASGGILSVQLLRERVAVPQVLSHSALPAGDYLVLSVADQGIGITSDVMEHLFEPFFTTRAAQSGTGLGLAVVHGVVTEFGGAIDVKSAAGQGARFTLYFPESTEAAAVTGAMRPTAPGGRGQRLLVVDDEPELVALAEEMLTGLGYAPVGYSDSTAALQALRDGAQHFDAVITDEAMPRLNGTQLTEALRQHLPDMPVLMVSGYGGALLAQRAAAAGVSKVLAKPLQRADLARVLAEVLG